jgi:hypothetical protein
LDPFAAFGGVHTVIAFGFFSHSWWLGAWFIIFFQGVSTSNEDRTEHKIDDFEPVAKILGAEEQGISF